ncbi:MAG: hypothetical protein IPK37_04580 [Austwickia sp.]|nr:MAG: hypothetical protein IPK37_04580 [Austwickia sp.]
MLPPLPRAWWPVLVLVAVFCVQAPDLVPAYPVDWVFVVPAVLAGSLLRMRSCAFSMLVLAVWWAVTPYADYADPPPGQLVAPEAVVDLVLGFLSVMAIVIVVSRERTAVLAGVLRDRAAAEQTREAMLAAVLASMRDAVALTERDGTVLLANAAAHRLYGDVPPRVTLPWLHRLGLRNRTGQDPDQAEVDRLLAPPGPRPVHGEIVRLDPSGERRHLATAQSVETPDGPRTVLLVRDITVEHARFRRLEWFATSVAGDLTEPLTTLDRRIDAVVAAAADPVGSAAEAPELVERAQEAVAGMRRSIEDYLVRAVARADGPTDQVVDLRQVTGALAAAHVEEGDVVLATDTPHLVLVDAHLVTQLFANALAVLVAGLAPTPAPRVSVRSRRIDARWVQVVLVAEGTAASGAGPSPGSCGAAGPAAGAAAAPAAGPAALAAGPAALAAGPAGGDGLAVSLCRAAVARHGGTFDAAAAAPGRASVVFTLPAAGAAS